MADGVRTLTHIRSHSDAIGILVSGLICRGEVEGEEEGKVRGFFIACWLDIGSVGPVPAGVWGYV